jgi:hypothetical protein
VQSILKSEEVNRTTRPMFDMIPLKLLELSISPVPNCVLKEYPSHDGFLSFTWADNFVQSSFRSLGACMLLSLSYSDPIGPRSIRSIVDASDYIKEKLKATYGHSSWRILAAYLPCGSVANMCPIIQTYPRCRQSFLLTLCRALRYTCPLDLLDSLIFYRTLYIWTTMSPEAGASTLSLTE